MRSHHLNDLGGEWQHPVAFADAPLEQNLAHLQAAVLLPDSKLTSIHC